MWAHACTRRWDQCFIRLLDGMLQATNPNSEPPGCVRCLNRWDQCFIRLLDGMLQVIGFAGASDGDFALRIPVKIRAISIPAPQGSACAVLPCHVQRVLGACSGPPLRATLPPIEPSSSPY